MTKQESCQRSKSIFDCFGRFDLLEDKNSNTIVLPNITVKGKQAKQWLINETTKAREEFIEGEKIVSDRLAKHLAKYETAGYLLTAVWLRTNDPDVVHLTKCSLVNH